MGKCAGVCVGGPYDGRRMANLSSKLETFASPAIRDPEERQKIEGHYDFHPILGVWQWWQLSEREVIDRLLLAYQKKYGAGPMALAYEQSIAGQSKTLN